MILHFLICLFVAVQTADNAGEKKSTKPMGYEAMMRDLAERTRDKRAHECPYLRNEASLYDLLRFRPIQKELGISEEMADKIASIKTDSDRAIVDRYRATEGHGGQQAFAAFQFEKQTRAEALDAIRGMLNQDQHKRLTQLAFHSEIEYLGLDVALTEGVLGKQIGVHSDQASHLRKAVRRLIAEERVKISDLQLSLQDEVIALLNVDERKVFESLLGPYFNFNLGNWKAVRDAREYVSHMVASNKKDRELEVLKEANSKNLRVEFDSSVATKYQLLLRTQIQSELALTDDQARAIRALKPIRQDDLTSKRFLTDAEQRVDEILLPKQQDRLDQVVQYLRIASYGYAHYITSDLGNRAAMSPDRRRDLFEVIQRLEKENDQKVFAAKQAAYDAAFKELTPEQRDAAKDSLGSFFYSPHYLFAFRRDNVNYVDQQ